MRDGADTGENYNRMNFCENVSDVEITPFDVCRKGKAVGGKCSVGDK